VGGDEAGEADGGNGAVLASPEGVGAEEAGGGDVRVGHNVAFRRALDADGVRDALHTEEIEGATVIVFHHAERSEIVIARCVGGNIADRVAWEVSNIVFDLEVGLVGVKIEAEDAFLIVAIPEAIRRNCSFKGIKCICIGRLNG
jgi:hypothetical protein